MRLGFFSNLCRRPVRIEQHLGQLSIHSRAICIHPFHRFHPMSLPVDSQFLRSRFFTVSPFLLLRPFFTHAFKQNPSACPAASGKRERGAISLPIRLT